MVSDSVTEPVTTTTNDDMDLVNPNPDPVDNETSAKRGHEDAEDNVSVTKKMKVDDENSVKKVTVEKSEEDKGNGGGEKDSSGNPVSLGPKTFGSSVAMFDYFYYLLHHWPVNLKLNKYEQMVLLDLIKKGHQEAIGSGINAFEIRQHPVWRSPCFFVVRADDSVEDFSFRKCVDHILPLPENMKVKIEANKALGGGCGGGKKRGGRGRGRGRR